MASAARSRARFLWGLMTLLSIGVGGYALFQAATAFRFVPPNIKANGFLSPLGLETHIAAAGIALLLGPFQFLRALRERRPRVHRWMGTIYVAACFTGGCSGGAIALYTTAGPVAGFGFLGLAVAWLFTTGTAWTLALRRDFVRHERWMVRSFALTLAAVTLRLYLPIAIGFVTRGEFYPAYRAIAWVCWIPNLIVAELWLAYRRRPIPSSYDYRGA